MKQANKTPEHPPRPAGERSPVNKSAASFLDQRPQAKAQGQLVQAAEHSPRAAAQRVLSTSIQDSPRMRAQRPPAAPVAQRLIADGVLSVGGLAVMGAEQRLALLKAYYMAGGGGQPYDVEGVQYQLQPGDFADILNYQEVGALQDRVDDLARDSAANQAALEEIGNGQEGMPRPMDLNPTSPVHDALGLTATRAIQLAARLSRSLKVWGDFSFPRAELHAARDTLNTDIARDRLTCAQVAARKDDGEASFRYFYSQAKALGVEGQIAEAAGRYVAMLLDAQTPLMTARSVLSDRLNTLRTGLIADANTAGHDPGAEALSVGGKDKAKALFENLMATGAIRLEANSIYRSEFEEGQWDFGAEWLLRSSEPRWAPFVDRWVLHGHLTATVPAHGKSGEVHDFSQATFAPKIIHVKPIAHREDTGWSSVVQPLGIDRLDAPKIKELAQQKSVMFNTVDKDLNASAPRYFTTALNAVRSSETYRVDTVAGLKLRIAQQRGSSPLELGAVDNLNAGALALETQGRGAMIQANEDFVAKNIGGKGKAGWLKKNLVDKVAAPVESEGVRINSFLADDSVARKHKLHYKTTVLTPTLEATKEQRDAFDQAASDLSTL